MMMTTTAANRSINRETALAAVIFLSVSLFAQSGIALPGTLSVSYHGSESSFSDILLPAAFAQTPNDVYRGSNYIAETLSANTDGTHNILFTSDASLPVYVESDETDSKGRPVFVPYMITEDDYDIVYETGSISWKFNKSTCTASLYSGGRIADIENDSIIENISWTLQEDINGWTNSVHNDYPCDVTITELANDEISLMARQGDDAIGFKEVEFKQKGGEELESWYRSPVADSNGKKYGFAESHVNARDIIHKNEKYDINIIGEKKISKGQLTKLENSVLRDEKIKTENNNGRVEFNGKNTIHDSLTDVTIKKYTNEKLQSVYDFHDAPALNVGERLEIDPVYSSSDATIDFNLTDSGNNDSCDGDILSRDSANSIMRSRLESTASTVDCYRAYVEWDIASIPAGSTITDTDFSFYPDSVSSSARGCDIRYASNQPSTDTDSNVWSGATTTYATGTECVTVGLHTVDLGSSADSQVRANLSVDWFGLEIKMSDETMNTTTYGSAIRTEEHPSGSPPKLEVTYTTPCIPDAPTSETAVAASTSQIDLSWTNSGNCTNSKIEIQRSNLGGSVEGRVFVHSFDILTEGAFGTGIFFKPDGMAMYVADNGGAEVNEYALFTAWDASSASYLQRLDVSAKESQTMDVFIKPDGTKLYVTGSGSDSVHEYDLSTPWNVSSASFADSFSVSAQDTAPRSVAFSTDGIKMLVLGDTGNDVNEYSLSSPWSVSSASFVDSFSVSAQEGSPQGMAFNADGTKMFITGYDNDNVSSYDLSTGFDVSTAIHSDDVDVSGNGSSPNGIFVKSDGMKMYIVDEGVDRVNEYDITWGTLYSESNFDISTASHLQDFDISLQSLTGQGIFFKPDGMTMYVADNGGAEVNEYELETSWDASSASYLQRLDVSAKESQTMDVFIKPDGTKLYVTGSGSDSVHEYDLSTPWDISTASFLQSKSVSAQDTAPRSVAFSTDGTKMLVLGDTGNDVNEYDLSTPWDISSASFVDSFSVSAQEGSPQGMAFNFDGTKMFITGYGNDNVSSYDLSTGFDVSTAIHSDDVDVSGNGSSPNGIFFRTDGMKMYIVDDGVDRVNEYDVLTIADSYSDTGLDSNIEYFYRIRIQSDDDSERLWSLAASANETTISNAPTALTATATSDSQIDLSWTAPSGTGIITGYRIERETPIGNGWTSIVADTGTANTSFSNLGLSGNSVYNYRVFAINAGGTSAASSADSDTTMPTAPTALTATASSASQINLSWTAPSGNATITGYKIEYESPTGNGFVTLVADTGNSDTTYQHTELSTTTDYNYRISAINESGTGTQSAHSNDTTFGVPSQVVGLTATMISTTQIDLSWDAPDANGYAITGYRIEYVLPGGGGFSNLVGNTGSTDTAYSHTGLDANSQYAYRVSAINSHGVGDASVQVSTFTNPASPTSLSVTVVSNSQLDLSWTAPSGTITGYKIEYESPTGNGFVTLVADTGSTDTAYSHTGLSGATQYNYQVSAIRSSSTSSPSNQDDAYTIPDNPGTISFVSVSPSELDLSWTAPSGTITGYKIEYESPTGNGFVTLVANHPTNAYTHSGLSAATSYNYRVSAINVSGTSSPSFHFGITTMADSTNPVIIPPSDITAPGIGDFTTVDIGTATATDDTDPSPVITNNAPASFPMGATVVTWTATDSSGNFANANQTITVEESHQAVSGNTPLNDLDDFIMDNGGVYFGMGLFTFAFLLIGVMAAPRTVPIFTAMIMVFAAMLHVTGIFEMPAWYWGIAVIMTLTLVLKRRN